jgi:hypothetical protein
LISGGETLLRRGASIGATGSAAEPTLTLGRIDFRLAEIGAYLEHEREAAIIALAGAGMLGVSIDSNPMPADRDGATWDAWPTWRGDCRVYLGERGLAL